MKTLFGSIMLRVTVDDSFFFRLLMRCLIVSSSFFFYSCKEEGSFETPIPSAGTITDAMMRKELPADALSKIESIKQGNFVRVDRKYFSPELSVREVISKLNKLSAHSRPVGQRLVILTKDSPSGAREGVGDNDGSGDPPNRRVSFYSNGGVMDAFDGRVDISYNQNGSAVPSDFEFTSNVSISAFGSNFGSYTQTGATSNSYTMSDGSKVVVFEIRGSYGPPLVNFAGISNDWLFTGFIIFSGGSTDNPDREIRGECTMRVIGEPYD